MDLYEFPQLYDALRAPDPESLDIIRRVLAEELPEGLTSLMDPACGPGGWLTAAAPPTARLAGNDLSERMTVFARQNLSGRVAEVVQGDMRDLAFETGPFDAALEASGTVSLLQETADFERLLGTLARHVRPGGVCLLAVLFRDPEMDVQRPKLLHETGDVAIAGGGHAQIQYESLAWDAQRAIESIRRTVRSSGVPGAPKELVDHFELRLWTRRELTAAVATVPELDWARTCPLDLNMPPIGPRDEPFGEQLVVLRRS